MANQFPFVLSTLLVWFLIHLTRCTHFPPEDNKWAILQDIDREDSVREYWYNAIDWFCNKTYHLSELVIEGVLNCNKNHLDFEIARKCADESYGSVKTFKDRRMLQCDRRHSAAFDKKFNECYIKAKPRYARDYLDAYKEYESLTAYGKMRTRREMAKKQLLHIKWNVQCMNRIKAMNVDIWRRHAVITEEFCNSNRTWTEQGLTTIMDCTLLGYDVAVHNDKRLNCVNEAFGTSKTAEERRQVLCDKSVKLQLHSKYAECYYGATSEEALEEKDNVKSGQEKSDKEKAEKDKMATESVTLSEDEGSVMMDKAAENQANTTSDAEDAIIIDLHKDFDGFFIELECMERTIRETDI